MKLISEIPPFVNNCHSTLSIKSLCELKEQLRVLHAIKAYLNYGDSKIDKTIIDASSPQEVLRVKCKMRVMQMFTQAIMPEIEEAITVTENHMALKRIEQQFARLQQQAITPQAIDSTSIRQGLFKQKAKKLNLPIKAYANEPTTIEETPSPSYFKTSYQ